MPAGNFTPFGLPSGRVTGIRAYEKVARCQPSTAARLGPARMWICTRPAGFQLIDINVCRQEVCRKLPTKDRAEPGPRCVVTQRHLAWWRSSVIPTWTPHI
jgi:hypothetical protein